MSDVALLDWAVIGSAALTAGLFYYLLLDTLQNRNQTTKEGDMFARVPAIRELSVLTGLTPTLSFLAFAGSIFLIFMVLRLLQGTTFALSVALILTVALFLSSRQLHRINKVRYLRAFESQLPIVIDQTVAQLRGGRSLARGLVELPAHLPEPAAAEMFEMADRSQRGLGLDKALMDAARKYKSRNYALLVSVFRMFVRQGGNVVDPLQRMSAAFKELIKADDYIRTASTQGRTIFFIINGAIFLMFSFVSMAQPQLIAQIFENIVGILIFLVGVGVYVGGAFWMWGMMRVDV